MNTVTNSEVINAFLNKLNSAIEGANPEDMLYIATSFSKLSYDNVTLSELIEQLNIS